MNIGQILRARGAAHAEAHAPDRRAARLIAQFEGHGKGWFWETLADGSLSYITDHVARTLGRDSSAILGCKLSEIVSSRCSGSDAGSERSLSFYLSSKLPFRDVVVRANSSDEVWWSVSGQPFHDDVGRFLGFSGIAVDLTEKRRSEIELNRLARYDSLTGLANREMMQTALQDSIVAARHRRNRCAVFLIDLDRFKAVNDTLGHPTGDALLREVASRLKQVIGSHGQVGRLGGDEFQAIFPQFESQGELARLAEEAIAALSRPYFLNGSAVSVGASIGIATSEVGGGDPSELIREADIALYAAKGAGRGVTRFFAPEMHAAAAERQSIEADLRNALALDELSVLFQPSVDVRSEKVCGFEALVRWTHPQRGPVSPAMFIPLAEECGAIHAIGEWVLRTACNEAAKWPAHAKVAVNLSPLQFSNRSLPAIVANAIASAGLPAHRLELEITEGVLLSDDQNVLDMIVSLKNLGIRLALDDFGTGYSSLGYIRKVAFDKIKIDQSFVRGASMQGSKNVPIIKAIVGLASALDMETTAEGVETQDELALVRSLGCTLVQGYIYGRPMSAADAAELVRGSGGASADGYLHARPERRRLIRSGVLRQGGEILPVRVRNISSGGALVESGVAMPEGTAVELDISLGELHGAHVRWTRGGLIGLQFDVPFDMNRLRVLGAKGRSPDMLKPAYLASAEHPHAPAGVQKERLTAKGLR